VRHGHAMNVFYIPSWYPDAHHHLVDGIFFHEMVRSLADHHPDCRIYVSLWGQSDRQLSIACMKAWLRHPDLGLRPRPRRHAVRPNLIELYRPTWSWRYRTARGNIQGVLEQSRRHFADAVAECGRIDVIHAQVSFPAGYVAMRLAAEHRIPFLVSEHMG